MQCPKFKGLADHEIRKIITDKRACFNCFNNHDRRSCDAPAFISCRVPNCSQRHHRAFHREEGGGGGGGGQQQNRVAAQYRS